MAVNLRATLILERNGVEVRRLSRLVVVDEAQTFDIEKAAGGGFATLPITEVGVVQVLLVESIDRQVTLRLAGQSDAGLTLNAGGFVCVVGATLASSASTNATVDNPSGFIANLRGVAGGT